MNKITFLFFSLFLCFFQAKANNSEEVPKISIRFENQSLESALIQLESATSQHEVMSGYLFLYQDTIVSKANIINKNFKNKTIFQVLDVLLANSGYGYVFFLDWFVIIYKKLDDLSKTSQHHESIQGKVVDESGKPVQFASIRFKRENTTIVRAVEDCTMTNADGNFVISAMPSNAYYIVVYGGLNKNNCSPRVVHIKDAGLIKLEPNLKLMEKVFRIG